MRKENMGKPTMEQSQSQASTNASNAEALSAQAPQQMDDESIPNNLYKRIAELAYYRAEQRGFSPGHEESDWLEAEKEVVSTREGSGKNE